MGTGTGIGRVRGLGSAKHGSGHWLHQRMTAAGNLILVLWLLFSVLRLPGLDYGTVTAWLSSPIVAVPMILMIISVFWHLKIGMQVVIEDYVHDEAWKFGLILILNFYAIAGGVLGIFAVAKIAIGGAAG